MSTLPAAVNFYDQIPFPSQVLPDSHPDRLAAVATLFGMRPQASAECRVLELGCAAGVNLIPMAERHPQSTFLGIDASARQIEAGQQTIAELDLKNIELRQQDILDVDERLEPFDYIICPGVFSWTPRAVQDKMLSVCRSLLRPQGVAYFNYETYPGGHFRGIVRQLIAGPAAQDSPSRRLAQGRRVLDFFSWALRDDASPYGRLLKAEVDLALRQPDEHLCHEFFAEDHETFYFHQFAVRAAAHRLSYLADAEPGSIFTASLGPAIQQQLLNIAQDAVSLEQHVDLIRNRAFRQSLLCHADVLLLRHVTGAKLAGLLLSGNLKALGEPFDPGSPLAQKFVGDRGVTISTPSPTVKRALHYLTAQWPRAVSWDELVAGAAGAAALPAAEREDLGNNLVEVIAHGLIEVHSSADAFVAAVSQRPCAGRVARRQAEVGYEVTNRRHRPTRLDEVSQKLMQFLDGQHDRAALLKMLADAAQRGELSILMNGTPAGPGAAMADILAEALDQSLAKLASAAMLIA